MKLKAFKTNLKDILPLRELFLQENNFQIRYHACHERNGSDSYLLTIEEPAFAKATGRNEVKVGYGSLKGKAELIDRDAIFEFYVIPPFRKMANLVFEELLKTSGATFIECQSNDLLLSSMLFEYSTGISSEVVLYEDHAMTDLILPEVIFRLRKKEEIVFEHKMEPVGEYVLERRGEIVATGGFMLHYNFPFADLYMEVREDSRGIGLGSFLLQEVKKECYRAGRVPAARCHIANRASRATLAKAGLRVAGFMLTGQTHSDIVPLG